MTSADGQVALLDERGHALLPAPLPFDLLDDTAQSLVLHFLFGPERLPLGLVWNRTVAGAGQAPREN